MVRLPGDYSFDITHPRLQDQEPPPHPGSVPDPVFHELHRPDEDGPQPRQRRRLRHQPHLLTPASCRPGTGTTSSNGPQGNDVRPGRCTVGPRANPGPPRLSRRVPEQAENSRKKDQGRRMWVDRWWAWGAGASPPAVRIFPQRALHSLCPVAGSAEVAPPGSAIVRGDRRAITPVDRGHHRHADPLPRPPPGRSPGRQSVHRPTHGYSLPRTMNAPCLRHFNPSLRCVTPPASSQVRSEGPIDQRLHPEITEGRYTGTGTPGGHVKLWGWRRRRM
jgi:hypothetical protein